MANGYDDMTKNLLQNIKDFGDIKGNQVKLQSQMLMNQIQAKQNKIFQAQERQAKQQEEDNRIQMIASKIGRYNAMKRLSLEGKGTYTDEDEMQRLAGMEQLGLNPTKVTKERYLYKLPPTEETNVKIEPGKFMGMNLPFGIGSRNVENFNEPTMHVLNGIKTQEDIDEILEQREDYEKAGVDIQGILDYYTK